MNDTLKIKLYAFTLDSNDPQKLAKFYADLLNWQIVFSDEEFTSIAPPGVNQGGYPGITFQKNPNYQSPVWPEKPATQQQMAHLDFAVNDVEQAVQHAVQCGAKISGEQFSEHWKVMFDPDGHPFCLCAGKAIIESKDFALL